MNTARKSREVSLPNQATCYVACGTIGTLSRICARGSQSRATRTRPSGSVLMLGYISSEQIGQGLGALTAREGDQSLAFARALP